MSRVFVPAYETSRDLLELARVVLSQEVVHVPIRLLQLTYAIIVYSSVSHATLTDTHRIIVVIVILGDDVRPLALQEPSGPLQHAAGDNGYDKVELAGKVKAVDADERGQRMRQNVRGTSLEHPRDFAPEDLLVP